jgi:hypothetical protein
VPNAALGDVRLVAVSRTHARASTLKEPRGAEEGSGTSEEGTVICPVFGFYSDLDSDRLGKLDDERAD